jgi:hypothetical protein
MTKQSLFQLLADNQIETLFQELKGSNSKYLNDLVLLESQWSDLRARERNGTISSEQSNLEVARIRKNLLELIERSFSTQAAIAMPFRKASGSGNRTWILLAAITVVVIAILFFLFPSSPDVSSSVDLKRESKSQSTSPTSSKDNQKGNGSASRMLEVPANNMTFNKGRIGDITYKFLSAELSEQNTEHWLLRLKIRGIKPAYGFLVGSNQMHISYGDFEKAPVSNSFAYINPGETADGVIEFEVPKEFQEVKLLIYNYADEPPLASIPFTW